MTTSDTARDAASPSGVTGQAPHRFLLLDGLRGVAAFAVIADHVPAGRIGELIPGRYLSVDFFFILSGFVLAHAYGARLAGGWSPWLFMRARIIRLYPLYLLGSLIGLAAMLVGQGQGELGSGLLMVAAFALFFLPAPPNTLPGNDLLYPANGPAWSLFFELVANLTYGAVARFLTWRVLAIVLAAGAALVVFTVFNHADVRGPGWEWSHFDAGLARVFFDFFAGIALYRLRSAIRLPAMPWWLAVAAFVAIIAVPPSAAYDAFAAIVLMPLLLAFASGAKVRGTVAWLCGVFGLLSYAVYVLHVPLFNLMQDFNLDLPGTARTIFTVAVVAAIAAAIADRVFDRPVRRWLGRVLPGRAKGEKPHTPAGEHG